MLFQHFLFHSDSSVTILICLDCRAYDYNESKTPLDYGALVALPFKVQVHKRQIRSLYVQELITESEEHNLRLAQFLIAPKKETYTSSKNGF